MVTRKRVSYTLATPSTTPPALGLPPPQHDQIGRAAPAYRVFPTTTPRQAVSSEATHPAHCLGVTALALDTTTVLHGQDAPGGILYTGGRDGLVASWEQGVPMKRAEKGAEEEYVKWERIGVLDDEDEGEEDDSEFGYIGGNARPGGDAVSRKGKDDGSAKWTVDREAIHGGSLGQPKFRQSLQTHTDWVNDLLLVNQGQTGKSLFTVSPSHPTDILLVVITASSDRSIRAWQPHSQEKHDQPALVGVHKDYVKCLAYAPHPALLFSGGLDRQINVWDIHSPKPYAPIASLAVGGEADAGLANGGDKGSVYALVSNSQGTLLASGTPERIIRLWDPRVPTAGASGTRSGAGQLVGHTDNVKALLMSEDGRYMLSGSSDSTVKLWSLAAQRCIHTFTHHSAPIWSLASSHPNLERFFSGDRAGNLCVTDLSGITADWGEGECTLLARCERRRGEREGTQGIVRIECLEDEMVWTATASADVARWEDVRGRMSRPDHADLLGSAKEAGNSLLGTRETEPASILGSQNPFLDPAPKERAVAFAPSPTAAADQRSGPTLSPLGVPFRSMISLGVIDKSGPYPSLSRGSVSRGASLYTASAVSLPRETDPRLAPGHARGPSQASMFPSARATTSARDPAEIAKSQFENRDAASDAVPLRSAPQAIIRGRPGLIRAKMLNDRQHVLTLDTAGKVSIFNIVKGICVGTFREEEIEQIYKANHGLVYNADGEVDSKEALDLIAVQIDGQSFVRQWCQVDTKNGDITVHLEEATCWDAEVYADQVGYANDPEFRPEDRINLGKWVLANLFAGLTRAEAAEAAKFQQQASDASDSSAPAARALQRGSAPTYISIGNANNSGTRQRAQSANSGGPTTPGGLMVGLATPAATPAILPAKSPQDSAPKLHAWANRGRSNGTHPGNTLSTIPQSPGMGGASQSTTPASTALSAAKSPRGDSSNGKDYFSFPSKKSKATTPGPNGTKDPSPTRRPDSTVPQTPGGSQASFIGKFKGFGGKGKKPSDSTETSGQSNGALMSPKDNDEDATEVSKSDDKEAEQLRSLEEIRSHPFSPPFYTEAPPYDFPEKTAVIISETNQDAGAWAVTYRSMVSRVERDLEAVEMAAPIWLFDFLFTGRIKAADPKKLTFILEPWPDAEEQDRLPALPASTSRLSAVQTVRVGKIIAYVCPRIDLSAVSRRESIASMSSGRIRPATAPAKMEVQADGMTVTPLSAKAPGKFMAVEQAALAAANRTSQESTDIPDATYPAEALEILCDGVVVPLDMTLAAVKHFIWNNPGTHGKRGPGLDLPSAADVVLHYRIKKRDM